MLPERDPERLAEVLAGDGADFLYSADQMFGIFSDLMRTIRGFNGSAVIFNRIRAHLY